MVSTLQQLAETVVREATILGRYTVAKEAYVKHQLQNVAVTVTLLLTDSRVVDTNTTNQWTQSVIWTISYNKTKP